MDKQLQRNRDYQHRLRHEQQASATAARAAFEAKEAELRSQRTPFYHFPPRNSTNAHFSNDGDDLSM